MELHGYCYAFFGGADLSLIKKEILDVGNARRTRHSPMMATVVAVGARAPCIARSLPDSRTATEKCSNSLANRNPSGLHQWGGWTPDDLG